MTDKQQDVDLQVTRAPLKDGGAIEVIYCVSRAGLATALARPANAGVFLDEVRWMPVGQAQVGPGVAVPGKDGRPSGTVIRSEPIFCVTWKVPAGEVTELPSVPGPEMTQ